MSKLLNSDWSELYNLIKDGSWPDILTEEELLDLPKEILHEILFTHLNFEDEKFNWVKEKNTFIKLSNLKFHDNSLQFEKFLNDKKQLLIDRVWQTSDIMVFFNEELEGSGTFYANEYLKVLDRVHHKKHFENCFEWCSGPGFIGFMLLANRICKKLTLGEIYKPCFKALDTTRSHLNDRYKNKVSYNQISSITDLPGNNKFDLIVGNPPHWDVNSGKMITKYSRRDRVSADPSWQIHENFYSNVKNYLSDDGIILLLEASSASGPDDFESMIDKNNLKIVDCYVTNNRSEIYFIEVTHK